MKFSSELSVTSLKTSIEPLLKGIKYVVKQKEKFERQNKLLKTARIKKLGLSTLQQNDIKMANEANPSPQVRLF